MIDCTDLLESLGRSPNWTDTPVRPLAAPGLDPELARALESGDAAELARLLGAHAPTMILLVPDKEPDSDEPPAPEEPEEKIQLRKSA